jgi:arginine utilization protein RocB
MPLFLFLYFYNIHKIIKDPLRKSGGKKMKWQTTQQLKQLLCKLVQYPSVSGSQAEVLLPQYVVEQLSTLDYFQENKRHLQLNPTGDGRYFVTALEKLNVPVLNVGPVGRDAHKWTERLNVPFAFETVKDLLLYTIEKVFEE